MKKTKVFFVLNIIIMVFAAGTIIFELFISDERDVKLISKAAGILAVYLLAFTGIKRKRSPLDYIVYEERYGHVIKNAFRDNKSCRRRLMTAIGYYNDSKHKKAVNVLEKLRKDCLYADDFVAVLFFKARCLEELHLQDSAVSCYEEILEHDETNSTVWSNLGLLYLEQGRKDDAFRAYSRAIECGPENAHAFCNFAAYYMQNTEFEKSIELALKAIELNSALYEAMGIAAMSYKLSGDEENAEKYRLMYGANGGDGAGLKLIMDKM